MAKRGPKPKSISALMKEDRKGNKIDEQDLFECLWKTRFMREKDIQKHFPNIKPQRLKLMFNNDLWLKRDGKGNVELGEQGKIYLENNMKMKFRYTSKDTAKKHDLILNKKYLALTPEQRKTWITENGIRHALHSQQKYWEMYNHPKWGDPNNKHNSKKFIPDAVIKKDGKFLVLEVITKNYTQTDIDQKCETSKVFFNNNIELITK